MTQRYLDQEQLTFAQIAKLLPHKPHRNTIYRWAYEGVGGQKLRSWKVGGRRVSSREALEEFFAATSGEEASPDAHADAESRLDRLGVKR